MYALDFWTLVSSNVCYEGLGSKYGAFQFNKKGLVTSMKLEHISGLISCAKDIPTAGSTIWTCHTNRKQLSTFITDTSNHIIFPSGVKLASTIGGIKFANRAVFKMLPKKLIYFGPSFQVINGTKLRIWNANDLGSDVYDKDNAGVHCVNVLAHYEI